MEPAASTGPAWPGVRLHVVTGKGGTGKTTVAAALALTLASHGRRILLAEVEGRQGISQTFDVPPLPTQERLVVRVSGGGEIWGLSVDAMAALVEYLDVFYHLGRAGKALQRLGAVDFATTIAPGVRDVLSIGKVYDCVRRSADRRRGAPDGVPASYDAVILDAPPTGRVVRFLNVNSEVADLAKMGPIRHQANSITELLRSPACAVHVVTLLEEMPVQEVSDTIAELRRTGLPVGAVIVNQAREPLLSDEDLAAALAGRLDTAALAADLARLGLPHDAATVDGLASQAKAHAERIALEDEQYAAVEALARPVYVLPSLPDGADADSVRELAGHLADQGTW
jgi:anion-transporting  ArsA/GET3 family ATPase